MSVERKLRILLVEDEMLIAFEIEEEILALGFDVVGPLSTLDRAMEAASTELLDGAVLDVTIRGGKIFPVAERLVARGIPFIFASGHDDWALPENLRGRSRLTKPFTASQLQEQLRRLAREIAGKSNQPPSPKQRAADAESTPSQNSHR